MLSMSWLVHEAQQEPGSPWTPTITPEPESVYWPSYFAGNTTTEQLGTAELAAVEQFQ